MAGERGVNPSVLASVVRFITIFSARRRTDILRLSAVALVAWAVVPIYLSPSAGASYLGGAASNVGPVRTPAFDQAGPPAAGRAIASRARSTPEETTSSNWSGYVETSGPFTAITGTFVVPAVTHYHAGSTVSEWVGVDGWANRSLIQAGVNEVAQKSGDVLVEPWWEVLPARQKDATGVVVAVGDSVTVTISEVSGSMWSITLTDRTNGDVFRADKEYEGQLSSAEWIVEANEQADGRVTQLAHYGPRVSFTKLGVVGPQTTVIRVVMRQEGERVSTPSAAIRGAMSVSYGSAVPGGPL
jgi:peptidase A4-like protein